MAEYKVKLMQSEDIPAPDMLLMGTDHKTDSIKLKVAGDYQRGTVLMSSEGGYVKATAEGTASGNLCILADSVTVPAESEIETAGYFEGTFNASSLVLDYEGDDDDHRELIETLKPVLRKQGIYVV